jgi:hypothetical protein
MPKRIALLSLLILSGVLFGAAPAMAEAGLTPSPSQVEFGAVDMHFGGSPHQSVQFFNGTLSPVFVFAVTIGGAEPSSFHVFNDGCSGHLLNPPENCSVEVAFEQGTRGAHSATLELSDSEGTVEVPLSGSRITGTLSANPNAVHFSAIPASSEGHNENENNETEQINIDNGSEASTQIESVSITGADASSFSIQNGGCERLMGENNECGVPVRFQPTSPGPKQAQLVITSDSAGSPLVIPLEGEGLHGPKISISSTQALLGEVLIGSSAQHTFEVTNSGDYPLGVQQDFLVSGTPLMFPILADTCAGHNISPGSSCSLTVGFTPTTPGQKSAGIIFITNTSPITTFGIEGVGVQPSTSNPTPGTRATVASISGPRRGAGHAHRTLSIHRAPRLYAWANRASVDTGVLASCPVALRRCETVSSITAMIPTHARHGASTDRQTHEPLGFDLVRLRGGRSASTRVSLGHRAIALLGRAGQLRARIRTVLRSGGKIVAEQSTAVTLAVPYQTSLLSN